MCPKENHIQYYGDTKKTPKICSQTCSDDGEYPNNITKLCTNCHEYCENCFGGLSTECSKCNPGWYLLGTKCFNDDDCPDVIFMHFCQIYAYIITSFYISINRFVKRVNIKIMLIGNV